MTALGATPHKGDIQLGVLRNELPTTFAVLSVELLFTMIVSHRCASADCTSSDLRVESALHDYMSLLLVIVSYSESV